MHSSRRALLSAGLLMSAASATGGADVGAPKAAPPELRMPKSAQGSGYRHGSAHTSTCGKRLQKRRRKNQLAKQSRRRNRHG